MAHWFPALAAAALLLLAGVRPPAPAERGRCGLVGQVVRSDDDEVVLLVEEDVMVVEIEPETQFEGTGLIFASDLVPGELVRFGYEVDEDGQRVATRIGAGTPWPQVCPTPRRR